MVSTATTAVEHAPNLSRDAIVLSGRETAEAYEIGLCSPQYALTFLAERDTAGVPVDERQRAKFELAAHVAATHNRPEPGPAVTVSSWTRVVPPVQTDRETGNRFMEAVDGTYRFTFIEVLDDVDRADNIGPHVIADADPEMDEHTFVRFAADAARFAREITAPASSSWNRGVAS